MIHNELGWCILFYILLVWVIFYLLYTRYSKSSSSDSGTSYRVRFCPPFYSLIWYVIFEYIFLSLLQLDCYLSNGLFFFERCNPIPLMVCAYELNNARSRVMKVCLHTPLQLWDYIFRKEQFNVYIYISKNFPTTHFYLFFLNFIGYVSSN